MQHLTTPEAMALFLGDLAPQNPRALQTLVDSTSIAVYAQCRRELLAPAEPVYFVFTGEDTTTLILPEWPVIGGVWVTIDGEAIPQATDSPHAGYVLRDREGVIILRGYRFPKWASVAVRARCGYDAEEARADVRHATALSDLSYACHLLARAWLLGKEHEPYLTEEVKGILVPYQRLGV